MKRSISIFGATGSVGDQTLDIVRRYKDSWQVDVLTAKKSVKKLSDAAKEFGAKVAVIFDESRLEELREALSGTETLVTSGSNALIDAAARPVDITMGAIVGCVGLPPLMRTIERGGTVALANKEALVSAGTVMTEAVKKYGAKLLPVDSEHNAIFQCLQGNDLSDVERITLTASGGPLRQCSLAELKNATPNQAIAHPNWDMGAKISVDSATMMNKGLEYIEAFHLFPVGLDRLKIVVHPQSIVHSMSSIEISRSCSNGAIGYEGADFILSRIPQKNKKSNGFTQFGGDWRVIVLSFGRGPFSCYSVGSRGDKSWRRSIGHTKCSKRDRRCGFP